MVWQGVDPSIRAEVWEFLLGCYAVGSTAEHRGQLRTARRFLPLLNKVPLLYVRLFVFILLVIDIVMPAFYYCVTLEVCTNE